MCGVRKINIGELVKGNTRRTGNNTSYACHAIPLRQAGSLGRWSAEACAAQALWCVDGQHILFSRGLNEIKSSSPNSKTVQKSRSFALQSVWEEASGKSIKYSSYWAEPSVIGVY